MKFMFFKIFKTSFGYAGVIFDKDKIYKFILPLKDKKTVKRLLKNDNYKLKPKFFNIPKWLKNFMKDVKNYFDGKEVDFSKYDIDLNNYTSKEQKILKKLRELKFGEIITYKKLSEICRIKDGSRFVGNTVAKNKTPLLIPCHRVIKSNKKIGNFSFGKEYKLKLLLLEKNS